MLLGENDTTTPSEPTEGSSLVGIVCAMKAGDI